MGFFLYYLFFLGYILFFGLVRLRTVQLSAQVGAHIECRCSCSHGEDVWITDVIIKTLDRKWHHARKRWAEDLGWFLKINSWDLNLDKASWFSKLGEASPVGSTRCAARGGVRWNSQHSKNCVSLSPRVENLKSQEGNKSFGLELPRVISVSSVFRDSYAYERFTYPNILRIHILSMLHLFERRIFSPTRSWTYPTKYRLWVLHDTVYKENKRIISGEGGREKKKKEKKRQIGWLVVWIL